jgi:hypothetical protein
MRGLFEDPGIGSYWLFSDKRVFEIVVKDEHRDVWSLYLAKVCARFRPPPSSLQFTHARAHAHTHHAHAQGNFVQALAYASTTAQKDIVRERQAGRECCHCWGGPCIRAHTQRRLLLWQEELRPSCRCIRRSKRGAKRVLAVDLASRA